LTTPALYLPSGVLVDVIQDGDEMAYVKFADGRVIWVKSNLLDFDTLIDAETERALDDDWGPENDDDLGFNDRQDDYFDDPVDYFDFEYDH
jgi:hypothetical protein